VTPDDDALFALSADSVARLEKVGGTVPVVLVDNVYAFPDAVREAALALPFTPPPDPYPGRLATFPRPSASLMAAAQWALDVANSMFLPSLPPISFAGRPLTGLNGVYSDFAIVDVHPGELAPLQRIPHTDPVPVFGLIYLNREERGGTLFFEQVAALDSEAGGAPGYITQSSDAFKLVGRIEPLFNRLAIYPGFVPHSGEIAGEWIEGEERFSSPRLTQRFIFHP
jgi:hypothetical protein